MIKGSGKQRHGSIAGQEYEDDGDDEKNGLYANRYDEWQEHLDPTEDYCDKFFGDGKSGGSNSSRTAHVVKSFIDSIYSRLLRSSLRVASDL